MNLLKDDWIPVRPLPGGKPVKITLRKLLCHDERWEVCLPRDDMELATIQLLICIIQVIFMPKTATELKQRIANPMSYQEYDAAIVPYDDWFQLDHPKYPFMQVRGVTATDITSFDKLLAGLNSATNSCFVNESGMGDDLCAGCAAIALFNQASCAPSFGGGFKASLRGSAPITTLIEAEESHLRHTLWLNVLYEEFILSQMPWFHATVMQKPTWIAPIESGGEISAQKLGLGRGLLWQPAHVELILSKETFACKCCGSQSEETYAGFKKAKFKYTVVGDWPHPHSPRIQDIDAKSSAGHDLKEYNLEQRFVSFSRSVPSWTQLSRFVVEKVTTDAKTQGQQPALVIQQIRQVPKVKPEKLHIICGGYRNNQASILERRHEVFTLNHGWERNTKAIHDLVEVASGYRTALYKALFVFVKGIKDIKGAGVNINQGCEIQYYRRSEPTIQDTLARIDFNDPIPLLTEMQASLKQLVKGLFEESVRPYLQDPELIKTMAIARRTLNKHLNNLEPQKDKGGNDGTAAA